MGVALYGFSPGVNNVALSLYVFRTLGLTAYEYGLILAAFPVGGLIAVLLVRLLLKLLSIRQAFTVSLLCMGLSYLGYSLHPPFFLAWALMLSCGLFFSVFAIVQGPMLQEAVPAGYMGRVSATLTPVLAIACVAGRHAVVFPDPQQGARLGGVLRLACECVWDLHLPRRRFAAVGRGADADGSTRRQRPAR